MTGARRPWAIYAITKHGLGIARRLREGLAEADLYVSSKFIDQAGSDRVYELPLPMGPVLARTFTTYDAHIFIVSVGAVVRMIAPLLVNKKVDPAVICVDDKARFTVPILSGHVGRGNEYAVKIAGVLRNTPVVTTASDVGGTLTVDILGRDLGWVLDDPDHNVTRGCAAVVNQEPVLVVQETGEADFWPLDQPLPPGVDYTSSLREGDLEAYSVILMVTDRLRETIPPAVYQKAVVYRPKSLMLGLGCDRDTPLALIDRGIQGVLAEHGLDIRCVKGFASIDKKADEPAFKALQEKYGWTFQVYTAEELDAVRSMPNPSATVKKWVGTKGVCEPAAVLAAGARELVVPKQIYKEPEIPRGMTVAVARIPFARREGRATKNHL